MGIIEFMQEEIEVKFIEVDHELLRKQLTKIGATCTFQKRLMKRAIIDYPDKRMQITSESGWGWVRVRDEGDKVTCTYKHIGNDAKETVHEIEYEVSSYDKTVELFKAIGLKKHSEQQTKRETWLVGNVEVVLDEWPWIPPYIEIEGESETAIREVAISLGFDWRDALTGSSDRVYRMYYPKMGVEESVGDMTSLTFDGELPQWLKDRL